MQEVISWTQIPYLQFQSSSLAKDEIAGQLTQGCTFITFPSGMIMLNIWKKMKHLQEAVVKKRDFPIILNASGLSEKHDFELHIFLDFSDFRVQPYKTPLIHYSKARFSQIRTRSSFSSSFHSNELSVVYLQ